MLENGLSNVSLIDTIDIGFVKIADDVFQEPSNVLHQVEDSHDTEKVFSLQIDLTDYGSQKYSRVRIVEH